MALTLCLRGHLYPFLVIVPGSGAKQKRHRQVGASGHLSVNLAPNLATGVLDRPHIHVGLVARDQRYEIGDCLASELPDEGRGVEGAPGQVSGEGAAVGWTRKENEYPGTVTARLAHMDPGRGRVRDVVHSEYKLDPGTGGVNGKAD